MRIGVFGGTFDPVHQGHLLVASGACEAFALDKVIFVPSPNPPHKLSGTPLRTEFIHRYNMVVLAVAGDERFTVSDIEQQLPAPSYSVNTITALERTLPQNTELYFITGMDAVCDLPTWRDPDILLKKCFFLAANRRPEKSLLPVYAKLGKLAVERIKLFDSPFVDISATDIRERLNTGKSIRYYLPASVEKYIYDNKLYS